MSRSISSRIHYFLLDYVVQYTIKESHRCPAWVQAVIILLAGVLIYMIGSLVAPFFLIALAIVKWQLLGGVAFVVAYCVFASLVKRYYYKRIDENNMPRF